MVDDARLRHLAFRCDSEGQVIEVLRGRTIVPDVRAGQSFTAALDAGSRAKAEHLLARIAAEGIVFDWVLNWVIAGLPVRYYVNAVRIGDEVWVMGAPTRVGGGQVFADVLEEAGSRVPAWQRAVARDRVHLVAQRLDVDEVVLNEFTHLQNELTAMQRSLIKKNVDLERLNREANYFVGMAAHELRNPLCSIRFYSDYLRTHLDRVEPEKRSQFLDVIHASSGFMARLIDDLLNVSRIESGHLDLAPEPTDLASVAHRVADLSRTLAEAKDIALELEAEPGLPPVAADEPKIEQVVTNLVTNAIKYAPQGTTVTLRAGPRTGSVCVSIADEGPGIPAEQLERLFEPFQTAEAKPTAGERSTGLGLYICRRIIEGHHGELWAESTVGRGSTFAFSLPVAVHEPVAESA